MQTSIEADLQYTGIEVAEISLETVFTIDYPKETIEIDNEKILCIWTENPFIMKYHLCFNEIETHHNSHLICVCSLHNLSLSMCIIFYDEKYKQSLIKI